MIFHIVTLFPEVVEAYCSAGVLGRAARAGLVEVRICDLREYGLGKHKTVDDNPYGGGAGRTLTARPICEAVEAALEGSESGKKPRVLVASAAGRPWTSRMAQELAREEEAVIVCGRYGGVDQRAIEALDAEEISIGDYVLTGGELPALAIVDSSARFVPGALGNEDSPAQDSFYDGLLGYAVYTRPREFRGLEAPEVFVNGNHAEIEAERRKDKLARTLKYRPELLKKTKLTEADLEFLRKAGYRQEAKEQ